MEFVVGKIYTFPKLDGAYIYLGGDPNDKNSFKKSVLPGKASAALSGATFQLQDEIIGGIRGAVDPNITYQQGIDLERRALEDYRRKSPMAAMGYEIAGAVVPTVLTGGATTPVSSAKVGQAMMTGAKYGGAYGVGSGEGLTDRAIKGLTGGLVGGAISGTVGGLAKPLSKVGAAISRSFDKPAKVGKEKAKDLLKDAIEADKTTIDEAIQYVLEREGKSYSLADIGPNTRAYLDAVNVLPGAGKKTANDFLANRNKGMLGRISDDITEAFGGDSRYFSTYKAMEEARKANGKKIYDIAFKKDVPVTDELVDLFKRDVMKDALNEAYKIANAKGVSLPRVKIVNGQLVTGKGQALEQINSRFLHYIKLGLDDKIYTSKTPQSGVGKTLLGANTQTKNSFLDFFDSQNPTYKRARDSWADKSSIMDSLDLGYKIDKLNPDELAFVINKMSNSEKEAFRNGVMNNIVEKMEKSIMDVSTGRGANLAYNIIKTPKNRRLLRMTFETDKNGTKKFKTFVSNLEDEIAMKDTANTVLGNSATIGRSEAVTEIKSALPKRDVDNLSPVGLVYGLFKSDYPSLSKESQIASANELARILTETNPRALELIRKEVAEKGFVQNILKKYLPQGLLAAPRISTSPQFTGIAGSSVLTDVMSPGARNLAEQTGLLGN